MTMTETENNYSTTRQSRRRARLQQALSAALFVLASAYSSSVGVGAFTVLQPMSMKIDLVVGGRKNSASARLERLRGETIGTGKVAKGTPLDMLCQDQQEFELCVGHAMDVLRTDYPTILTDNPDYSIYDPNLELIDPSGVQLHGLKNYKAAFRLLHAIVGIFYCPERSGLTFRMCFDKARQNIRIHWNAQVIPKALFGGYKTTLHVDGISVYEISRNSGNITQHRIERLVINDNYVTPEKGIFAALRDKAVKSNLEGIPVFNAEGSDLVSDVLATNSNDPLVVQFQGFHPRARSVLFTSSSSSNSNTGATSTGSSPNGNNVNTANRNYNKDAATQRLAMESGSSTFDSNNNIDFEAFERKNMARKKFGLAPLTPEEYQDLQKQVAELDSQQQQRAAAAAAEMAKKKLAQAQEQNSFFKNLFGKVLENTCEDNYDCQRPEVCCDFGFKKMCCTSGMRILDGPPRSRYGQLAEVPVIANPGPNYPPRPGSQY